MDYIDQRPFLPPFRVRTLGCIRYDSRHFTPGTRQGDTMLILNLDGEGIYRNSQEQIRVTPSMVGLIPFEDCGVLFADLDNPYLHYYCRFGGDYAKRMAEQIIADRGGRFFHVDSIERLVSCIDQLPGMSRQELPEYMGEYELALSRILVTLMGKQPERQASGITAHALRQYIELNLGRLVNLDEMARHFGITKPALCRIGKRLLGTTIVKASNAIRTDYARELLKDETMTVAEVAQHVGFDDPFYFSRVFKQQLGISPKKWQLRACKKGLDRSNPS